MGVKSDQQTRRTQQERTAATRARVLDATIEHLAEFGYGRTTTVEVAERAGVSRGALVHHFPTRSDLVLSALEYLCERRLAELEAGIAHLGGTDCAHGSSPGGSSLCGRGPQPHPPVDCVDDRLSAFVDLMWGTFSGPLFLAQLELWIAARTDPLLFDRLYPLERGFGKRLSELCNDALGDRPGAGPFYELTKQLMRGMAMERLLKADETERTATLERWKALAVPLLRGDDTPSGARWPERQRKGRR